jgi:hypothetical protein
MKGKSTDDKRTGQPPTPRERAPVQAPPGTEPAPPHERPPGTGGVGLIRRARLKSGQ